AKPRAQRAVSRRTGAEAPTPPTPAATDGAQARAAKPRGSGKAPARRATAPPKAGTRSARTSTGRSLVIVESPTKSRTLTKFLGRGFTVMASNGHIMDLPKSKLGVDLENDFEPEYVPIRTKNQALAKIKAAAREADQIYLAPDPDREGEAIAWHL